MTKGKVIERLLHWAPQLFAAMPLVRARCILTTRVAIDVLARFGIVAEPRPVICQVSNQAYEEWKCFCADHPDATAAGAPPSAWAVIAGLPPEGRELGPKDWAGHLVAFVPARSLLIDLDFQQFARPRLGAPVPPAFAEVWPADRPSTGRILAPAPGQPALFVRYERNDENDAFLAAPDWNSDRDYVRAATDAIERAIRKGGAV
jgi:hypothetical protein